MNAIRHNDVGKYYMPERVFFCNMVNCCQCRTEELLEKIEALMIQEIEESVDNLLSDIKSAEQLKKRDGSSETHFLSKDFIDFVEKEMNKKTKRASPYLLTRCYTEFSSTASMASSHCTDSKHKPTVIDELEIIHQFQKIYDNAEPLSIRDLNRILSPIGKPLSHNKPQIGSFSAKQADVVTFVIQKVLPNMLIHSKRFLFSRLASKKWQDIVYKCQTSTGYYSRVIEIDPSIKVEFENTMNSCFGELKQISECPKKSQNVEQIGNVLMRVYNEINDKQREGMLRGIPDSGEKIAVSEKQQNIATSVVDDVTYVYDGFLCSHIINLMDWTHVVHEDTRDFMEYMDRIVDKVRASVLAHINIGFTMDELRKFHKGDQTENSLFLWDRNEQLLRLLINAIHEESSVIFEQHNIGG